uniref:Uncharacterized protein n=1 Tax=Rhizophora mucronata TaxID=61149 RepID=A0A2P2QR30_RHIMU
MIEIFLRVMIVYNRTRWLFLCFPRVLAGLGIFTLSNNCRLEADMELET